jgi:hypothetical protein
MWQRFEVNRKKEKSMGPELFKLLFPFGTIPELQEKKDYLLPLRSFQGIFFWWWWWWW